MNKITKTSILHSANAAGVLVILVIIIDLLAWNQLYGGINNLSVSTIFPLLGILAWTIMWSHYIMSARDISNGRDLSTKYYWTLTRIAVLVLIILHPLLLAWKQWNTSGLLPPNSFYSYVASSLKVFIVFGSISLIIFLSFEVFNHLKDKAWVIKNYRWIELSQMIAMILIWLHALKIGSLFGISWFMYYWYVLGLTLLPCFYLVFRKAFVINNPIK